MAALTGLSHAAGRQQKLAASKPQAAAQGVPMQAHFSRGERVAIIKAAIATVHESVQTEVHKQDKYKISRKSWGEAIRKLQPLRVINDRMNIMIVMTEDSRDEKGFYVTNMISSYLVASNDPRFAAFEPLSKPGDTAFGELYRYHIKKK